MSYRNSKLYAGSPQIEFPEPWTPEPRKMPPPEELNGYRLEPARNSRYWQVIDPDGELVCITVYKRGAREVMRRLAR